MTHNYFESEARIAFKSEIESGELTVTLGSAEFFQRLAQTFIPVGSRIDWTLLPNSIGAIETSHDLQATAFENFFRMCIERFNLTGLGTYAGDSATDFLLRCELVVMQRLLPVLFEIPQHHFFAAEDFSWCACFTIEGDMHFGFQ
jgi:hypothetical protein